MTTFKRISCQDAQVLMAAQPCQIIDIRDDMSYQQGHPTGAQRLDNNNTADYIAAADLNQVTLVFCYHGNSSQGAASFLAEQDFKDVYSVDGGFEEWKGLFPDQVER